MSIIENFGNLGEQKQNYIKENIEKNKTNIKRSNQWLGTNRQPKTKNEHLDKSLEILNQRYKNKEIDIETYKKISQNIAKQRSNQ